MISCRRPAARPVSRFGAVHPGPAREQGQVVGGIGEERHPVAVEGDGEAVHLSGVARPALAAGVAGVALEVPVAAALAGEGGLAEDARVEAEDGGGEVVLAEAGVGDDSRGAAEADALADEVDLVRADVEQQAREVVVAAAEGGRELAAVEDEPRRRAPVEAELLEIGGLVAEGRGAAVRLGLAHGLEVDDALHRPRRRQEQAGRDLAAGEDGGAALPAVGGGGGGEGEEPQVRLPRHLRVEVEAGRGRGRGDLGGRRRRQEERGEQGGKAAHQAAARSAATMRRALCRTSAS